MLACARRLSCTASLVALLAVATLPPPARPAAAPADKALAVGTEARTGPGERRRLRLPGGAALYLNGRAELTVTGRNRITLRAGEVFVEAPAGGVTVEAPGRSVTAAGARFGVRAGAGGSAVVVASGQATVSGLAAPVRAGQSLAPGAKAPAPSPRVSHLLGWARELMGGERLVPVSPHAGGALVARGPDGEPIKLELRRFHVDVHVEDGFARTTIDQTYFNHSEERLEGTFYFPLPPDASLSRLAMYVDGKLMEGGMAEREHARTVYETIRYTQRDPALLEWVDGSTFKMRVFPLEGRHEKRLLLSYTQKLPSLYGQQSYRFPAGHSLGKVGQWSFAARVRGGAGLTWGSPSHALEARKADGDLILTASGKDVALDKDLVFELAPAAAKEEATAFATVEQDGAKYLLARYRPALPGAAARQRRDWVFVVETSGDRDALLGRTQAELVRGVLESAEPDDTFALLTANTRTRAFHGTARPVTPENVTAAVAFLHKAHRVGALDLGRAFDEARPFAAAGKAPVLVHVGSGVPTLGELRQAELVKRLPKGAPYVGVGVGRRWGRALMKAAAEATGGHFTQVNPDEPIAWRAFDLVATLDTPRLLDVRVKDRDGRVTLLPFVTSVAQGEEVAGVARVEAGRPLPAAVVVEGTLEGRPFSRELKVERVREKAGYLPRTWARLEIERLLKEDARANKEKIIGLSKAMYVMTPYTSLLVLENEDMYAQFKVDRGRKDHWAMYPAPERIKVVHEPLHGEVAGKGQRPAPREVAKTVVGRERPPVLRLPVSRAERRRLYLPDLRFAATYDVNGIGSKLDGSGEFGRGSIRARRPFHPIALARLGDKGDGVLGADWAAGDPLSPARLDVLNGTEVPAFLPRGQIIIVGNTRTRQNVILRQLGDSFQREQATPAFAVYAQAMPSKAPPSVDFASAGPVLLPPLPGPAREGPAPQSAATALLHARPRYNDNAQLFADLVSYAPGLNTSRADLLAVLETEARPTAASKPGTIDPGARALLARPAGWQAYTVPAAGDCPAFAVSFDGTGRFTWRRKLSSGLSEQVVCDGTTLHHVYPELGLAARRAVSRFHRLDFSHLVPFFVPAPEDLARGADVRLLAAGLVAVVRHGAKGPHSQLHYLFDDEGRLLERRLVALPSLRVLWCERIAESKGPRPAEAPALRPDLGKLVVLDLPFRTAEHVSKALKIEKKQPAELTFAEARALLAAHVAAGNGEQALALFRQALHARDQRALGYYVLLAAAGANLDSDHGDVLGEHPDEPLAHYLALHSSPVLRKHASQWAAGSNVWAAGTLRDLASAHALLQRWSVSRSGKALATSPTERGRALAFVKAHLRSAFSVALLTLIQDRAAEEAEAKRDAKAAYAALAEAWGLFAAEPGLGRVARYERARCLLRAGKADEARRDFRALFAEASKASRLLPLDGDFVEALRGEPGDGWGALMRERAAGLVKGGNRAAVLVLAKQCWELGESALAENLRQAALDGAPKGKDGLPLALAGLQLLYHAGQYDRADAELGKLLAGPEQARLPGLWRLGAKLAEKRDLSARRLECLEKALALEDEARPDVVDLTQVREEHEALLGHYGRLAEALVALKLPAPADFRAKVVRAADRWRELDRDAARPCELAAQALRALGERELAWDYLTTPAALKPNEAEPWGTIAGQLRRQGELALADRAYEAAFAAEPTNAELLWQRAQLLKTGGHLVKARALYRQIADGAWQPRFAGVKAQARWELESR
jgi:hypothetical protein